MQPQVSQQRPSDDQPVSVGGDLDEVTRPKGQRPSLVNRNEQPGPASELQPLAQRLGVDPLVVRLLIDRGVAPGEVESWLAPKLGQLRPPREMAGFEPALALLEQARTQRWRVGIFGDYDVDGVSTAAILATYLEALGLEVVAAVANRDSGYGLGIPDAKGFVDAGVRLVVTGDVGTSDVESLQWLRDRGVKTMVIDHHQVPKQAPPTDAFINPHQSGCAFPFKGLCSAGVAFYLCAALRTRLRQRGVDKLPDPRQWLDLVAVATVCDMMPLRDENRVLVRQGLRFLSQRTRPGLRALLEQAGVDAKLTIDEEHVGFRLGPRLNAPGRLGTATPSLRLLRARTDVEAGPLAEQIETINTRRKRHTESMVAEALAVLAAQSTQPLPGGVVVAHHGWHPGIAGIAAAELVEHCGRPAVVLASDPQAGLARGSVRSCDDIDVLAALRACSELIERFGGHRQAAGLSIRVDQIPAFQVAFARAVDDQRTRDHRDVADRETVDGELSLDRVDTRLVAAIETAGPFGVGFAPPRFVVESARVERLRVLKERHLSLTLQEGTARREAIAFGQAWHGLGVGEVIGAIYVPFIDHFRGEARLRIRIERLWRAEPL